MARHKKDDHEYRYRNVGRPSKLTPESVTKLEEAAAVRATDTEMCFYANVSRNTFYRWMKENPQLRDRLDELKQKPFLIARMSIVNHLNDPAIAFKFLEKEKPEEYADRLKIEHSGENVIEGMHLEDEELRLEYKKRLMENIRKRAIEKAKSGKEVDHGDSQRVSAK